MCLSTVGFVLAMLNPQRLDETELEDAPKALGYVTVELKVEDASHVYGWQAVIEFNPQKIMLVEVAPGDFLDASDAAELLVHEPNHECRASENSFFVYRVIDQCKLVMAQTLLGEQNGKSGSGTLAYIKFAYLTEDYQSAYRLVFDDPFFGTLLVNNGQLPTNGRIFIG